MEITAYPGETQKFSIVARSSKTIPGLVKAAVIDKKGVTMGDLSLLPRSELVYVAQMDLSPELAPGLYQGSFEVRVCRDDPRVCAQPLEGSPWNVPYKITVQQSSNLTTLRPLAGVRGWSGMGGQAARNADVTTADIKAANFTRRWRNGRSWSALLSDGGRLYTTWDQMAAFSEHDGALLWENATHRWLSGFSAGNGKLWGVYADYDSFSGESATTLLSVDGASGSELKKVKLEAGPPLSSSPFPTTTLGPVVDAGSVYAGTTFGLVSRLTEPGGASVWSTRPVGEVSKASGVNFPFSVAGGRVVGFDGVTLWSLDASSGAAQFKLPLTTTQVKEYQAVAPVLGPSGTAYASTRYASSPTSATSVLMAVDLAKGQQRWTKFDIVSRVVERQGLVYGLGKDGALLALDVASGREQWRWELPEEYFAAFGGLSTFDLILVGPYAFISVGTSVGGATYAVDLGTHQTAWRYPTAGALAVTENGTLLIDGSIAINLQ